MNVGEIRTLLDHRILLYFLFDVDPCHWNRPDTIGQRTLKIVLVTDGRDDSIVI